MNKKDIIRRIKSGALTEEQIGLLLLKDLAYSLNHDGRALLTVADKQRLSDSVPYNAVELSTYDTFSRHIDIVMKLVLTAEIFFLEAKDRFSFVLQVVSEKNLMKEMGSLLGITMEGVMKTDTTMQKIELLFSKIDNEEVESAIGVGVGYLNNGLKIYNTLEMYSKKTEITGLADYLNKRAKVIWAVVELIELIDENVVGQRLRYLLEKPYAPEDRIKKAKDYFSYKSITEVDLLKVVDILGGIALTK